MIQREEIMKLASLSRLKLSEDEIAKMQTDMTSILAYVDKLKSAGAGTTLGGTIMSVNKNVLREDSGAHAGGVYTEKLIKAAPRHVQTKNGLFVKVKKILGGSQ